MWQASRQGACQGESLTMSRLASATTLKQGGRAPIALLQGQGVGHCGFPGCPAHPLSPLFYDSTQSRPPKSGPRCNSSKRAMEMFGGKGTKPLQHGGWTGGPLVTCQKRGRDPQPTC